MQKERIYLSSPAMNGREMKYVQEAFDTNWVAPLGANVDAFEKELAEYVGTGHAAALSAGTAALHLALKCVGVGSGDVVFSSSLTFSATCNPIKYQNAIPVFIDSEPASWNLSPRALKRAFEKYPHPKAVIVAHLYGTPAMLDEIMALCEEHGVPLIEDAAESLGSTYHGRQTGSFGELGIFSFNGNKIITTSGGGMLVSGREQYIRKARFWATQARDKARHYQHSELGYNYRMSNICAGIGRGQLETLDQRIRQKTEIYNRYKEGFSGIPEIRMNPVPEGCGPNHWLSCITLEEGCPVTPLEIMELLEQENIESRPIWKPMNLQPYYAGCDFFPHSTDQQTSVGEDIFNRGLCLPSDVNMSALQQNMVISKIQSLFHSASVRSETICTAGLENASSM